MATETAMRDQHDTQTSDLIPAKLGRPCLDAEQGPMTPAERAKRYRANRKGDVRSMSRHIGRETEGMLQEYSDAALMDAIRDHAAFLNSLLSRGRATGATPAKRRVATLVAELARRYPMP